MRKWFFYIVFLICFFCMFVICSTHRTNVLSKTDVRLFEGTRVKELAIAVDDQDTLMIKQILERNPEVINDVDSVYGLTVLNQAVYNNKLESSKFLLRLGADPSKKNKEGKNSIIDASLLGKCEFIKMFSDCCIGKYNESFFRSLYFCVLYDYPQSYCVFDILSNNGTPLLDKNGEILGEAINQDRFDRALILLNKGAKFNDSIEYDMEYSEPQTLKNIMSKPSDNVEIQREKKKFIDKLLEMGLL